MKVFLTKDVLVNGIKEIEVEKQGDSVVTIGTWTKRYYKNDWHYTKGDAIEQAEKTRQAKIASLEKEIERLKEIKF